jgi:hypothetical protein
MFGEQTRLPFLTLTKSLQDRLNNIGLQGDGINLHAQNRLAKRPAILNGSPLLIKWSTRLTLLKVDVA